jgi:hypothetical protein
MEVISKEMLVTTAQPSPTLTRKMLIRMAWETLVTVIWMMMVCN